MINSLDLGFKSNHQEPLIENWDLWDRTKICFFLSNQKACPKTVLGQFRNDRRVSAEKIFFGSGPYPYGRTPYKG